MVERTARLMGGNYPHREMHCCKLCNIPLHSPISIEEGICGLCARELRARHRPEVLQYLLSRGLPLD